MSANSVASARVVVNRRRPVVVWAQIHAEDLVADLGHGSVVADAQVTAAYDGYAHGADAPFLASRPPGEPGRPGASR